MKFLDGLAGDIKQNLLGQLRVVWTHTSTALEGNTLTLGETDFVLREGLTIGGRQTFVEYSDYWEVPRLMERWLEVLNGELQTPKEPKELVRSYARLHVSFAAVHPFYDGNGRIARLISNLPCLKSGQPPIIIFI